MKKRKDIASYTVVFTTASEGGYVATVPALPGCISEGDSFEEAKKNIEEAIALYRAVAGSRVPAGSSDFIVAPVSVSA